MSRGTPLQESGRRRPNAAPLLLWIGGLLLAFHPALLSGFARLQISHGDPRLVHYILEHSWRWAAGFAGHGRLWSPPVFHPAEGVGAYSDVMLGAAPLYWVWRFLGAGPGPALQLWLMTALSLSFAFTYLWLRRAAALSALPAAAGAFLFAFGAPRLASFNSPQLFPLFYGSFALYAASRALPPEPGGKAGSAGWVVAFFAALAMHAWSAFYPAFFLACALAVAATVALVLPGPRARLLALARQRPAALAGGVALCGLALYPLAHAYLSAASELGFRGYAVVDAALPRLSSWVFPGPRHWLYGGFAGTAAFEYVGPAAPHSNGVGFVTSVAALAGLFLARRRPLVQVVALTALLVVLVSTRWPGGFSLWRYVYDFVPGAQAVRFVARIGMYLSLAAALGVGLLVQRVLERRGPLVAALLVAAACAEQGQSLAAREESRYMEAVRAVAARVDPGARAFLLTARAEGRERDQPLRQSQIFAMWVGAEAGVPTINGFYGNAPAGWELAGVDLRAPRDAARIDRALEEWVALHGLDPARVQRIEVGPDELPWGRPRQSSRPR